LSEVTTRAPPSVSLRPVAAPISPWAMIAMVVMVMDLYLRGISGDCRKTTASPPAFCAALRWWAAPLPTPPNDEHAVPPGTAQSAKVATGFASDRALTW
jgi:hypothetical protein